MTKECKGCGYTRSEKDDHVPDWECPSCGHAYVKTERKNGSSNTAATASIIKTKARKNENKHKNIKYYIVVMVVLGFISIVMNANNKDYVYNPTPSTEAVQKAYKQPKKNKSSISVKYRVTEMNEVWWKYAWILTIKNKSGRNAKYSGVIKFLDVDGFIIDDDSTGVLAVSSSKTGELTGYALIRTSVASKVTSATAEVNAY